LLRFRKNLKNKEDKSIIREFLKFSKKSFLFVGLFSLFINILMLLPAIYMLAVYDIVVPSRSQNTLFFITILVVILFAVLAILQIIRGKILIRINNKMDAILNERVIDSMYKYALRHPTKASIQPFNDFQQIKNFLSGQSVFAFFDIPWTPIYIFILFLFHPYYGMLALAIVAIVISITFINEYSSKKYLEKSNEALIKSNKFLTNTLSNIEIIEALGMRKRIYNRWFKTYKNYLFNYKSANDKIVFWSNTTKTFRMLSQSLMLGLGGLLAINLQISSGMIVAGSIVLGRALAPLDLIISTWRNFSSARMSYKRLNSLLNEIEEEEKKLKLPEPEGEITLREVVVIAPDTQKPILRNINMHINAGEMVAIVGPSGAGKSSLIRTILGLWKPINGKVEIDGADIEQWDREYLGRYIGYLPQDIELFEGTVAENIARFEKAKDEDILEAARISGAHNIIVKLPKGYNTYIGPGGITLSGGQRQRIGLARALYKIPKIVVLDEPNSNLDEAGEIALYHALLELKKKKRTVIIITHKINILEITDKIAVLKEGQLKLFGPKEKILPQILG